MVTSFHRGPELQSRLNCCSSSDRSVLHVQHASNAFFAPTLHPEGGKSRFFVQRARSNPCGTETGVRCCFVVENTVIMMPCLSREERERALGIFPANLGVRIIARRMNRHYTTISRLRGRFRATGRTADRPRTGQPRVTISRQDVFIRQQHLRDWFMPATVSSRQIYGRRGQVCANTVRRRLQAAGIRARRPYVGRY